MRLAALQRVVLLDSVPSTSLPGKSHIGGFGEQDNSLHGSVLHTAARDQCFPALTSEPL